MTQITNVLIILIVSIALSIFVSFVTIMIDNTLNIQEVIKNLPKITDYYKFINFL